MIDLYVSTVAFRSYPVERMIELAKEHGWGLEFSSGIGYRPNMADLYLQAGIKRMPHNYFPSPKKPFVLNLASIDPVIRGMSVRHCMQGLQLAKSSGSPFFAAHAGFCIDPDPASLGRQMAFSNDFAREANKSLFIESIREILAVAERLEVRFLIENNVIAGFNYIDRVNPFLCCEQEEITWMYKTIDHRLFGVLLDTAHLKVSCHTLEKDRQAEVKAILPYTGGVHHSDNDGINDTNQRLTDDYWFMPFLNRTEDIAHVLEVKDIHPDDVTQQLKYLDTQWN